MFTGIVQGVARVAALLDRPGLRSIVLEFPPGFDDELQIGASVACDGVCLTVTERPAPDRAAYCATKGAVVLLTETLAVEWGPAGVRVNALAPGYVETDLVRDLAARGRLDPERLKQRTPLRRLAQPAEMADLAVFLASRQASYINGHTLVADGGWSRYSYL